MLIHEMTLQSICEHVHPNSMVFIRCGDPIEEWVVGVSRLWRKDRVLKLGHRYYQVYVFHDGPKQNLVFDTGRWIDHGALTRWKANNRIFRCEFLGDYVRKHGHLL